MKDNTPASETRWYFQEQHEQQQQEQQADPQPLTFADEAAARKFFEEKGFRLLTDSDQATAISQALSKSLNEIDAIVEEKFGVKKDGKKTSDLLRSIDYKKPEEKKEENKPDDKKDTQLAELLKKVGDLEKRANDAETAARTEKINAAITTGLGAVKIAAPEGSEAVYREVAESAFRAKFSGELKDGKLTFKDAAGVAQVDASGNPKTVETLFREHFAPLVAVEKTPSGSGQNGGKPVVGSKEELAEALHKRGLVPGSKAYQDEWDKAFPEGK